MAVFFFFWREIGLYNLVIAKNVGGGGVFATCVRLTLFFMTIWQCYFLEFAQKYLLYKKIFVFLHQNFE